MTCNLCERNTADISYVLDSEITIMVCDFCYETLYNRASSRNSKNPNIEIAFLREYVAAVRDMQLAAGKVLKMKGNLH